MTLNKLSNSSLCGLALRTVIYNALALTALFGLTACGGSNSSSSGSVGSTELALTLPFQNYTIDSDSVRIDTGSGIVHASIGPFGAHFDPLTGHLWGDAKGNFLGFMARSDAELTFFNDANGNGICEAGDVCGFDGGVNGVNIIAMQPTYVAPVDATVTWVSQDIPPGVDTIYLGAQPHWRVVLQLNSRYQLGIGHLGAISTELHDKILAATGIDTDTYTAGDGVNLVAGVSIPVSQGEALAHPQLVASEVAGHPGYYLGGGTSNHFPWAQMEFALIDNNENSNVCIYDLLSTTEQSDLTNAMIADMQSVTSPRYGGSEQSNIWKWGAEAVLCPVYAPGPDTDFSDIHTHLGGWVERANPGVVRDELFSIIKIQTGSAMYNASNYETGVTHLVSRQRLSLSPAFSWTMPDMSMPGDIFYPSGEVLEETANSLLIMWRDFSSIYLSPIYQRAAYQLDADGLKIKWGDFADSSIAAAQPVLGSDACNDTNVICYDHKQDLHI
jgi:hypothetical protein